MAASDSPKYRRGIRAIEIGVMASADEAASATPTITAGSGAPASAEADGSIYLRTDATDGDDAIYAMISSSWVAIKGQTA